MLFVKVRLEETMKLFEFEEPRDLVELSQIRGLHYLTAGKTGRILQCRFCEVTFMCW